MRKINRNLLSLSVVAGSLALSGLAQNSAPTQDAVPSKIAFVDSLGVLYGTEEGKQEIGKVNQFIEQKQSELQSQQAELNKLQETFSTQERSLNVDTRMEMQRTIEEKNRQLQRLQEDTQLDITRRRDGILNKMSSKVQKIIEEYAQQKGLGAVMLRDQTHIYVHSGLEVTQDIIKIYNERNPVSSP